MIADLKPYPSYKGSGMDWLGDVPKHWAVKRTKSVLSRNESGVWGEDPNNNGVIVLRSTEQTVSGEWNITAPARRRLTSSEYAACRLREGDLVVTKSSGSPRHIGKTSIVTRDVEALECCFSNFMQRLRVKQNTAPRFVWYAFNGELGRRQLDYFSDTTTGLANLNSEIIGRVVLPSPSLSEQTAIVRFLDYFDRRIRRYIRAKQKLIALLEEQKQALIHRAVTRGLDPNVRLKPSGVEWLGDVPEHWEVRRLKTLCSMKSGEGITAMSIEPTGEYPVYGGNGLRGYTSNYTHDGNFVLIGRQGALCGNVHVARGRFWASEHAVVAALDRGHALEWFRAVLGVMNLNQYSIAAAQPGLAVERVLNLWLPVLDPQEQAVIAAHIEKQTAGSNVSIAFASREIDLLREYHTCLIADVVTGKLDVRAAASRLPDEIDETGALIDGEEEPSDGLDTAPEEAAV